MLIKRESKWNAQSAHVLTNMLISGTMIETWLHAYDHRLKTIDGMETLPRADLAFKSEGHTVEI